MDKLNFLFNYLKYKMFAKNEHGIHSPFVFELYCSVFKETIPYYIFRDIESIRSKLLLSNLEIEVTDYGAGSNRLNSSKRKVNKIARYSLKPQKYAQLLFRLVNRFKPQFIVEFGTCLGITTMYLATSNSKSRVITVEGCTNLSKIAKINFDKLGIKNIELINKQFNDFLIQNLSVLDNVDFVYFDGNHTEEATIKYFNECISKIENHSVFVFDDIYWSRGMTKAWNTIKNHERVTTTIDLFSIGIVFFNPDLSKENFVLKF